MSTNPPWPLSSKTCLVTGATGALGLEVARRLASLGAEVVLVARDAERGETARQHVVAASGNPRVGLLVADLADRDAIKRLVTLFMADRSRIDVLVHAAGTFEPALSRTGSGAERTWATNVLGPYQLTARLVEMLRYCRPSRVVFVSSDHAGGLDLSDTLYQRRPYDPWAAYDASQQAVRMLAWGLADKLAGEQVGVHVVDPGPIRVSAPLVASRVARGPLSDRGSLLERVGGARGLAARLYRRAAGISPAEAAEAVLQAATDPALEAVTGRFLQRGREVPCPFRDPESDSAVLNLCARTTRVFADFDSSTVRDEDSVVYDPEQLR